MDTFESQRLYLQMSELPGRQGAKQAPLLGVQTRYIIQDDTKTLDIEVTHSLR
jgi:hypothetical protein